MQAVTSPSPEANAAHHSSTAALYRKVTWKLMPLLFVCYVLAYIDRANIGFAHLQFRQDVGLSEAAFGFGVGLFYLGYMLLEVPSNLWLQRIGIRRTLLRIMTCWGVVSVATAFVRTPIEFYAARVLLGVAEAGFFPGAILYFTNWFPASRRAHRSGKVDRDLESACHSTPEGTHQSQNRPSLRPRRSHAIRSAPTSIVTRTRRRSLRHCTSTTSTSS